MNKMKVGEFLASKRNQLGLSVSEMARRIGCNRTTVERNENGSRRFHRRSIDQIARAYEVDVHELADLCGYPTNSVAMDPDSQVTASIEDLEFLITVARGLQRPMNITTMRELLKCRQTK